MQYVIKKENDGSFSIGYWKINRIVDIHRQQEFPYKWYDFIFYTIKTADDFDEALEIATKLNNTLNKHD